jgi:threonylcarbamoyladenosine tRNA methylthiotransferase MtaB
MKISFYTLGCKVNQLETEALIQHFSQNGFSVAPFSEICDVYVINTCTVTATSDKKCRQAIRKAKKNNPAAIIAVTGCYSQINPDQFVQMGEVDIVTGTKNRLALLKLVQNAVLKKKNSQNEGIIAVEDVSNSSSFEPLAPTSFFSHTRGSVKIQDGCENFCSYCIIPYARGPVRSMDFPTAVNSVQILVEKGFSEIVLTGIQISAYGKNTDYNLLSLLTAVNQIDGDFRIRLGSLNPMLFTPEFTKALASLPKLCPHFHISLQSGCDKTLTRMNRKYTTKQYANALFNIRSHIENVAITTDVIVGFPGESEEDFQNSAKFVSECAFSNCHVFPFSPREGTVAASFDDHLPNAIKEERSRIMNQQGKLSRQAFFASQLGKEVQVLFETQVGPHIFEGYSENYIPVRVESRENLQGRLFPVILLQTGNDFCTGKLK